MEFQLSPEGLAGIAGVVLSLILNYIPGLNTKFAELSSGIKSAIIAGLLIVITAAIYGGMCFGWFNIGITCDKLGIFKLIQMLIAALVANQGTYVLSPMTKAVRVSTEERPETTCCN